MNAAPPRSLSLHRSQLYFPYHPTTQTRHINPSCPFGLTRVSGGISSSPAFVIMFVMQHFQISWEDALHYVQNRRYCISPNSGFITQIKVRHPAHKPHSNPEKLDWPSVGQVSDQC